MQQKKSIFVVFDNIKHLLEGTSLSATSQALLFHLIMINNELNWRDEFQVRNSVLQDRTGITSFNTFRSARDTLVSNELIEFTPADKKRQAGTYKLTALLTSNNSSEIDVIHTANDTVNNTANDTPIHTDLNKHNETKPNETNKNNKKDSKSKNSKQDLELRFEKLWTVYPKKQGRSKAFVAYQKAIKDGVTDEEIAKGITAYVNYSKNFDAQYIKQGSSWFNQQAWEDDYSTPPAKSSQQSNGRRQEVATDWAKEYAKQEERQYQEALKHSQEIDEWASKKGLTYDKSSVENYSGAWLDFQMDRLGISIPKSSKEGNYENKN